MRDAWEHPALFDADLVILDPAADGGGHFIGEASARVMVCSSDGAEESVLGSAAGRRGRLPAQGHADAREPRHGGQGRGQRHAGDGARAVRQPAHGVAEKARSRTGRRRALTDREQQVLALIAAGHPTREVALQLCYSERTVKNVLHDVVTKLNARSRSQAVAFAVREGLI